MPHIVDNVSHFIGDINMTDNSGKTHYRKAFDSPYLSSADIVEPTIFTIARVSFEKDKTKKTKDDFNVAHFAETHIREGEKLKPMILNAGNSKTLKDLSGSPFIDDWQNIPVTIYVDNNVRFGRDVVDGLRIHPQKPKLTKRVLTKENEKMWNNAITAYKRDGNLSSVLEHVDVSEENQNLIIEAANVA